MKIGDHRFTLTGDPDQDRDAGLEEAERIWALAARGCPIRTVIR